VGLFVSAATTIGDPAEFWCSALFSAAAQALIIATAQAKPTAKIAIVRLMIAPYNEPLNISLHCRTRKRTGIRTYRCVCEFFGSKLLNSQQNGLVFCSGKSRSILPDAAGCFLRRKRRGAGRGLALTTASIKMKWKSGRSAAATFEGEFSNVTNS
jgi:hypothetical protein